MGTLKEILNWKSLLLIIAYSVIVVLNRNEIIDLPNWLMLVILFVFIIFLSLIGSKKKDGSGEDDLSN